MDILIIRDGGATKIPRTISGADELQTLMQQGMEVEVVPDPAAVEAAAEPPALDVPPAPQEDQPPEA